MPNERVSHSSLIEGFELAVTQGLSLTMSAIHLIDSFPEISLGLAQLGQEEVGKSLSILAAISLRDSDEAWKWFWKDWKNHNVKAHRAFLYELFYPTRLEVLTPSNVRLSGLPMRSSIAAEKEASFYVNYDSTMSRFVLPAKDVKQPEVFNRVMAANYLARKACSIHEALTECDVEFRYQALSEIAFLIVTENVLQQNMPAVIERFRSLSEMHVKFADSLHEAFGREDVFWREQLARGKLGSTDSKA